MYRKSNSGVRCEHESIAESSGRIFRSIIEVGNKNLPHAKEDGYTSYDGNDHSDLSTEEITLDVIDEELESESSVEGGPESELERLDWQHTYCTKGAGFS